MQEIRLRLRSTGLVHSPGYIRWLRCMYRTEPAQARRFMSDVYRLKASIAEAILREEFHEEQMGEDLQVTITPLLDGGEEE